VSHCGHENAIACFRLIVVGVNVAENNIKVFSVAMDVQQWVLFALLLSYRIFRTVVNSSTVKYNERVSVFFP
jgi:hypothetical protein